MPNIKTLLVTLLLISGVMIGFGTFYADVFSQYSVTSERFESLNRSIEIYSQVEEMYGKLPQNVTEVPTDPATYYLVYLPRSIVNSISNAVLLLTTFPTQFSMLIEGFVNAVGMPQWVISVIYGVILISIIFALIYIFLGKQV